MGRLFQDIGKLPDGTQWVKGTNLFFWIKYKDIPQEKVQEVTYPKFVCTIREHKKEPNRTRITVGGNHIQYGGECAAPTAHLDTAKLLIDSVLLHKKARFLKLNIENFYLETPMKDYNYMLINIKDVPQEVIYEYNLLQYVHKGWVYIEIRRGIWLTPGRKTFQ